MRVRGLLLLPALALSALSASCPRPASDPITTDPAPAPASAVTAPRVAAPPELDPAAALAVAAAEGPALPGAVTAPGDGASAPVEAAAAAAPAVPAELPPELVDDGSDNLPQLEPPPAAAPAEDLHELASIARETWIFAEPSWTSRRIGYLRAGAIVTRRAEPSGREGCGGGWYRIEPSGYVCIGASATLNIHDLAVAASSRRPVRSFAAAYSESAAPAKGDAAPAKGDAAPAKGDAAPAKGDAAPAKGDAAPAKGDAALSGGDPTASASPTATNNSATGNAPPSKDGTTASASPTATNNSATGNAPPSRDGTTASASPASTNNDAPSDAAPSKDDTAASASASPARTNNAATGATSPSGDAAASASPAALTGAGASTLGGLPYLYVMSGSPTPPLYARLPSEDEQRGAEPDLGAHLLRAASAARAPGFVAPPPPDPIPWVLLYDRPAPALAGDRRAPDALVLGRARTRSGFALLSTFDHDGRRFGLTTDLAVLPLDRTRVIRPSAFSGLRLDGDVTLPVAFAKRRNVARLVPGARGGLTRGAPLRFREATPLSGRSRRLGGVDYLEARDGALVRADEVERVDPIRQAPRWAARGGKWIDVSIVQQSLVAYEGTRPVYVTLVSTGADGLGDPKTTRSTIQGLFRIHTKHVTVTMDGDEEDEDPFDFRDVPFVQYFTEGFAFHAAYWHDDFGTPRSHGCVNLAPLDAAWLFEWTTPEVPSTWHGALSLRRGTLVNIRP